MSTLRDKILTCTEGGKLRVRVGSDFERIVRPLEVHSVEGWLRYEYADAIYCEQFERLQPIGTP
jgi:hypothetical protein